MFNIFKKDIIIKSNVRGDIIYPNQNLIFDSYNIEVLGKIECKNLIIREGDVRIFKNIECDRITLMGGILRCEYIECSSNITGNGTIYSEWSVSCIGNIYTYNININEGNLSGKEINIKNKINIINGDITAEKLISYNIKCNNLYITHYLEGNNILCEENIECKILKSEETIKCKNIYSDYIDVNSVEAENEIIFDKIKKLNIISCYEISYPKGENFELWYWKEKFYLFGFKNLYDILNKNNNFNELIKEMRKIRYKILDCKYWTNIERMVLLSWLNEKGIKNYKFSDKFRVMGKD